MSVFTLELEVMVGTEFKEAVSEAKELVGRLGIAWVKFKFNDVRVSVNQKSDPDDLYEKFQEALRSEKEYKFVI